VAAPERTNVRIVNVVLGGDVPRLPSQFASVGGPKIASHTDQTVPEHEDRKDRPMDESKTSHPTASAAFFPARPEVPLDPKPGPRKSTGYEGTDLPKRADPTARSAALP